MITVARLIEELKKMPPHVLVVLEQTVDEYDMMCSGAIFPVEVTEIPKLYGNPFTPEVQKMTHRCVLLTGKRLNG